MQKFANFWKFWKFRKIMTHLLNFSTAAAKNRKICKFRNSGHITHSIFPSPPQPRKVQKFTNFWKFRKRKLLTQYLLNLSATTAENAEIHKFLENPDTLLKFSAAAKENAEIHQFVEIPDILVTQMFCRRR